MSDRRAVPEPTIEVAEEVTGELLSAVRRLVPQLSESAAVPADEELVSIVGSAATSVLIARQASSGDIVGMLTLVTYRIPTGLRSVIEDVVVDKEARGGGVGEALVRTAIDRAVASGCRTIDLTSRPDREAANRLYMKVGFAKRSTNHYRYSPGPAGN